MDRKDDLEEIKTDLIQRLTRENANLRRQMELSVLRTHNLAQLLKANGILLPDPQPENAVLLTSQPAEESRLSA